MALFLGSVMVTLGVLVTGVFLLFLVFPAPAVGSPRHQPLRKAMSRINTTGSRHLLDCDVLWRIETSQRRTQVGWIPLEGDRPHTAPGTKTQRPEMTIDRDERLDVGPHAF